MSVIKGLKNIQKYNDDQDKAREARANRSGDDRKSVWLSLKDGESVKVRPLQELDSESENYSEKNGLGFIAVEHSNPKNYRRKGLCTMAEEGSCFGCEKHKEDYKAGWGQKSRLYLNVLVDNGKDEPFVAILSQGNGPKSVTPTIIEYAGETGSITNRWWKITRKGAGLSDTSYNIMAYDVKKDDFKPEDYEVFDLDARCVREVPYADQAKHYLGDDENGGERETVAASSGTSSNFDW